MSVPRPILTLGHSPDPDDVFMWWPITGMVDPRDHSRVTRPPEIDAGHFSFRALPDDIDVLNRRAAERGDLDITALSINAYAHVRHRYALTTCGSSMGFGYGPKLVVRADSALTGDNLVARMRAGDLRVAVPGVRTTAFLAFSLIVGGPITATELPFDRILTAVSSGEADLGLLIHQAQLTFSQLGLRQVADVGQWWLARTGLPLPLGGNAVRRDLDQRFGAGTCREVAATLLASIRHALAHRDESLRYAMSFAPEIDRAQADRYIDMYVNDLTLDARPQGLEAVRRLLFESHRAGLGPDPGRIDMVEPGAK